MSDELPPVVSDDGGFSRIADFCDLAMARTGVDAMTVTVASVSTGLEVLLATDALAERVAELEQVLAQGPGIDAMTSGLPMAADDLINGVSAHRWPLFAPEAVEAGVAAIHAYPITVSRAAIGVVELFSRHRTRMSSDQHRQALAVTELIGLALIDPLSSGTIGAGLRMSVHQAAGMVMVQTGMSIKDALVLLRSTAFTEDAQLTDLAADVIAGRRRFGKVGSDDIA
jgi:hypothetical protein